MYSTAVGGFSSAFALMTYTNIHTTSFQRGEPTPTALKTAGRCLSLKDCRSVCVCTYKCFFAAEELIPQAQIPYLIQNLNFLLGHFNIWASDDNLNEQSQTEVRCKRCNTTLTLVLLLMSHSQIYR